uniref:SCP domain-containing protein n=1 Tax=Panagrolaimus davidi TaxID=227884 RepID=A0A914P8Z4_9BILA
MFKILVLCVIFEISAAAVCPGSTVTQALQDTILSTHNNFRSQLAKGLSVIKGGALASGAKNMYELTYDCDLEATAQTLANKCLGANTAGHSPESVLAATNTGENLYSSNTVQTTQALLIAGMNDWWGELVKYGGITPTDVKFTLTNFALGIGHWTQMAWGKTTTVGCAFKQCPSLNNQVMVVCHYRAR